MMPIFRRQEDIKALNLDMMTLSGDMTDYVKEQEDGTFSIEDSTSWEKRENAFSGKDGIGEETYEILQKIVENQENRKFRYEGEQTEEGANFSPFAAGVSASVRQRSEAQLCDKYRRMR